MLLPPITWGDTAPPVPGSTRAERKHPDYGTRKLFNLRLAERDIARVREVARARGISQSELVRAALQKERSERGGK